MLKQRIRTMNNKLKGYRVWKNITQKELSEELNISFNLIQKIENYNHYPKYQVRKKLCDYFGINQEQLFILDNEGNENNE